MCLLPYADAATASNSIHKVILASSIVSIMWDWWERGPDYLYSGTTLTQQRGGGLSVLSACRGLSQCIISGSGGFPACSSAPEGLACAHKLITSIPSVVCRLTPQSNQLVVGAVASLSGR